MIVSFPVVTCNENSGQLQTKKLRLSIETGMGQTVCAACPCYLSTETLIGKDILNTQTVFWQIRPDELVLFEQDIKNAMELLVDFRMELNAQNLFAVLHHIDGAVL